MKERTELSIRPLSLEGLKSKPRTMAKKTRMKRRRKMAIFLMRIFYYKGARWW